ncbi:MAG TPA: hypothetical protein VJZ27_11675, partial [Aggregatilineales bacterium]|nr:hypothetical protein [Aggregatilineales bacterium]
LGMAFLTDVSAIFFLPAIMYILFTRTKEWHRRFAIALWIGIAASLFLEFPLHAQLKDELFPTGVFLGGGHLHLSLYETQSEQFRRASGDEILREGSSFVRNFKIWLNADEDSSDAAFVLIGLLSAAIVMGASFWNERLRPLGLMMIFYSAHLVTANWVYDTDIIPLLPLMALSFGVVLQAGMNFIEGRIAQKTYRYVIYAAAVVALMLGFGSTYVLRSEIYTVNQVDMQLEASSWVSHHVHYEAIVVTDNYAFVDLRETIPDTHYYWTVDTDPEVRNDVLINNWCNIDYMLVTPQMIQDMNNNRLRLIETAYLNSTLVRVYDNNGWPIEIREVNKRNCNIPFP